MEALRADKRRFKRIYFPTVNGVEGVFELPGSAEKPISAKIIDLSLGGIGLTLNKSDSEPVNKGASMVLKEVRGEDRLDCITNIEMEVKWILNKTHFEHVLFGCEFVNAPPPVMKDIGDFMDAWQGFQ